MAKKNTVAACVKICGITNVEDAVWAANLGADFVGINFCAESPRKVSVDKAAEIVAALPPFVKSVGIFVQHDLAAIGKILKKVPLKILQLHGLETPEFVSALAQEFALPLWKALHVQDASSIAKIGDYAGLVQAVVLDSHHPVQMGGTGQTFDWQLAQQAQSAGVPIVLSGGLNAENVAQAIDQVRPWCVDVASGVEKTGHPKKKDLEKMKAFILHSK